MEIKASIKLLRERAGLSQEALAHKMGRSVSAISKWDRGFSFPALYPSEVPLILSALDCTLDELIEAEMNWRAGQ